MLIDPKLNLLLSPWFITGFSDAESSFSRFITRNNKVKLGWTISIRFNITLRIREKILLEKVQRLGRGVIKTSENFVYFDINSINDLKILIAHFEKYPLISRKRNSFYIFVCLFNLYTTKKHLTPKGLG